MYAFIHTINYYLLQYTTLYKAFSMEVFKVASKTFEGAFKVGHFKRELQ